MLVAACGWLSSVVTHAQDPRVVVLDFAGKGGDKARIQVIRALRGQVSFEKKSAAQEVFSTQGLTPKSVAGRAAVARDLSLDYVVWGSVRGKGSAARAKVRVAGPKGKEIASREAGPPGTSRGNARIQKATLALLARARVEAPPRSSVVSDDEARRAEAPPAVTVPPPVATAPATVVEEPVAVEIEVERDATEHAPYVLMLGGAGGRTRKLDVSVENDAGEPGTRTYESGVFVDIVFRLEVRPLARSAIVGLRGLVLEADGDFGVGLDAQPPGSTTKLDTTTWRVTGQLGYFHRFKKGELGGLLGIGFDRLKLETNGTLPSVDYLYLRLGPAYRHFIVDRLLYLRVDGGFRYPFSYGDLGATFGDASGFGFDAALMLGGELDVGFAYAARVSFDYFKPQFAGFPSGDLPPLPGAAQGRDATDLAINFHVMIGWAF